MDVLHSRTDGAERVKYGILDINQDIKDIKHENRSCLREGMETFVPTPDPEHAFLQHQGPTEDEYEPIRTDEGKGEFFGCILLNRRTDFTTQSRCMAVDKNGEEMVVKNWAS